MEIIVKDLGKRFQREWIFRHLDIRLSSHEPTAVIGNNGSGKSTLLKILAGYLPATTGKVAYLKDGKDIPAERWFEKLAWVGPYTELIEEFTLIELLSFHSKFKPLACSIDAFVEQVALPTKRPIVAFSSGMKQKLQLALALFSQAEVLFFDEPTSNLDKNNIDWFLQNIQKAIGKRLIVICSNQPYEYQFCNKKLNVMDFKP